MGLNYRNLDERTREVMLSEIQQDIVDGSLYLSDHLNEIGRAEYPKLLVDAATSGSDESLAEALRGKLNSHEKPRKLQSGGFSKPPIMRKNACKMLAEGEFNRFYIRAICKIALLSGNIEVAVFRAKTVSAVRRESEEKIGQLVSAKNLLDDLRSHKGIDTSLGLPAGPNSGLSVYLL